MSGTSLDGVDIAELHLNRSKNGTWTYKIGRAETIAYTPKWKRALKEAVHFSEDRLHGLDRNYTLLLAQLISTFIAKNKIENLDAVCSHGHTVLHRPEKGVTLQIGNLPQLSRGIGQRVVCNFRVQDVALGGQGAPLVPVGDALLFAEYDHCLNLGGFANVSTEKKGRRIAYDVCPVNIVLNPLAEQLGLPYDDRGKLARSGAVCPALYRALWGLGHYKLPPPKSLGLEWVQANVLPVLNASKTSIENKIRTFTDGAAAQLSHQFEKGSKVLVTGGGAHNTYLLDKVKQCKEVTLVVPGATLVAFKEALVFGLLGV
ncbi:MAG: anhydro-N-acetylmuramic acid kinase, partial [Marinirhabdus sp.]